MKQFTNTTAISNITTNIHIYIYADSCVYVAACARCAITATTAVAYIFTKITRKLVGRNLSCRSKPYKRTHPNSSHATNAIAMPLAILWTACHCHQFMRQPPDQRPPTRCRSVIDDDDYKRISFDAHCLSKACCTICNAITTISMVARQKPLIVGTISGKNRIKTILTFGSKLWLIIVESIQQFRLLVLSMYFCI